MKLIRRIQYLIRRRRLDADLAEELQFHSAMIRRELEESGLAGVEARHAGLRAMGNLAQAGEAARAVWIAPWLESLWQDLAYAMRSLRRQPGFTITAVAALAFAIGLNTSVFTIFNAVALRPWAVPDGARMVSVYSVMKNSSRGQERMGGLSITETRYLSDNAKSMAGLFVARGEGGIHIDERKSRAEFVSGNYFAVLRAAMERGRGFLPEEDRLGAEAVAVLSFAAWQDRYGADPAIVGRRVRVDDVPFIVVGVAPRDFGGTSPERTDVWFPIASLLRLRPNDEWVRALLFDPHACCTAVGGRLAPGVSREQARAELSLLSADFRQSLHETGNGVLLSGTAILEKPGRQSRQIYGVFGLMFAAVMLVLLLACANVGNLLLARATARRREIGIRMAVGAGRARIVRQLLTESLALAILAGAAGVSMAYVLPARLFTRAVGEVSFPLQPDATVLGYTLGLSMLACLAFGLAPALHGTQGGAGRTLQQPGDAAASRLPLRSLLLAVQVAISVILLAGAGLMIRGVQRARTADPGFRTQGVASVAFDFPANAYGTERQRTFFQDLTRGLEEVDGAQPFGLTALVPLGGARSYTGFRLPGEDEKQERSILVNTVSAGYFGVLQIPILAGRNFTETDGGRRVVLVNQAMADRCWPGENPVGKSIVLGNPHEVVGLVRNAATTGLDEVEPAIYSPMSFAGAPHLMVRQTPAIISAVTALAGRLDARVRVQVTPLSENLNQWLSTARMGAAVAGILGLIALVLAAIGVLGVSVNLVQQRTQEIGIRMALGARSPQVVRVVLGSAVRSLAVGFVVGLAGALAGARLIRQYLFGLSPLDPVTYAAVLATLAAAGIVATYLPARRAIRVDPIRALHYE